MSGHSKWNNIKRKKEKTDAQKAKVFTKIGREITVVVREGGSDPANNAKLRDLIAKAKSLNVPNDNITRTIKRAEGGEKDNYESILYEGYGPSGIAVMVETLTDNRNRTAANMRHYFDKYGGNLGQSGSVAYLFSEKGLLLLESDAFDEEQLMEDVFEAGAEDFDLDDGVCEVVTEPGKVHEVSEALTAKGHEISSAEVAYVPSTRVALSSEEDLKNFGLLVEHLEEDDDVQDVWHNLENEEDLAI
ncbi:YebC/PmpR family DNA-binding transcriptional regulator [Ruminococcaceae bacterium OttesenSCG-928-I18]|nr:YebC/PmpR family DNA-binding transcriptional regulator [Ruminococcaceae bacterium OttesenSCG-928-I18]